MRKGKSNPCTILSYLIKAWGVCRNVPLSNIKKGQQVKAVTTEPNPSQWGVIDSLEAAKLHFSARNLFIAHCVEEHAKGEKVFVFAYVTKSQAEH